MSTHTETAYLTVANVTKRFGPFTALDNVSFSVRTGEFLSVLGPSGCGKTTILRAIAGLELQDEGTILIQGRDVSNLPVSKRNVGIVFQSYALFPNLSAGDNVSYGLRGKGMNKTALRNRVAELLELVGLMGMEKKYPAQLSGGQQQRVALARAMALSPDLLLLDEPLSALDAKVRVRLRAEIRALSKRIGVTTIMVTHDQEEALTMADRILVMSQGRVAQFGTPHQIYDRPASPFVAGFIGSMNFLCAATKAGDGVYTVGAHTLRVSGENGSRALARGSAATVAIRPEDVLVQKGASDEENVLTARILHMEYRGSTYRLTLELPLGSGKRCRIEAEVATEKVRRFNLAEDMPVDVSLPSDRIRIYEPDAETPAASAD